MAEERMDLEKVAPPEQSAVIRPGYPSTAGNVYPEPVHYGYGYDSEDEKVYVRRMWRAIKKRKWLIAAIAAIVTTVVMVEVFRTKSLYRSSATIEIGKENRTLVRSADVVIETDESDDSYYVSTAMKTKIRLLQSRPLLEDVVVALKLDQIPHFLDINERKSIWEAIQTIGNRVQRPDASATTPVINANLQIPEAVEERSPEESARLAPYVNVLDANLSAEPLPDTRMLVISFTHTDPVLAATVANAASRIFIARSFETKTEKFRDTSEWLARSTRELEARVQQAEQELANYSRANNIFSTAGEETLTTSKLSRLHDQATRAETDRILKQSLFEEAKAGRVAQLPESFSDPKTAALQTKLGELKVQQADMGVKFGPKNKKVMEVNEQIAAIEQQISESRVSLQERLKADYERAVRDEVSLKQALERAKAESVNQNQAAIQSNILQQKIATAKDLYKNFLEKTNQVKIQSAEQHNNLRLVDPARAPMMPVGPNRVRTIFIGLMLSLVAGVCLVLFLEYLDNTIKTVEDVQRYTQLPALSVIPAISSRKSPLLVGSGKGKKAVASKALTLSEHGRSTQLTLMNSRSSVAEAYRVLRTSVLLSTAGQPPKTILVTSARPGEGKTTTTINTAISLAQLGASVLIIDCDLRKPSAHKALGVDHSEGLSTYLSRDVKVEDLIQPLPILNLSILASGPIPPNPSELISSTKMRDMLRSLEGVYDHILIDSPPLINVTDPVILSTMVDGVILVAHGGKSTRDLLRRARQELATANAKIFGVVLNNVNLRRDGYDDYYYDRYYGNEQESASGD